MASRRGVLARTCPGLLPGSTVQGATHRQQGERQWGQALAQQHPESPPSPSGGGAEAELAKCRGTPGTGGNPAVLWGGVVISSQRQRESRLGKRALLWALCGLPVLESPRLQRDSGWNFHGIDDSPFPPTHTRDQSLLPPGWVSGVSGFPKGLSCRGGHASPSNSGMGTCLQGLMPKEGPQPQPPPPGSRGLPTGRALKENGLE